MPKIEPGLDILMVDDDEADLLTNTQTSPQMKNGKCSTHHAQ
jgi:hypothetical protein